MSSEKHMNEDATKSESLISVVIPTYNRAKMVCECVERVLAADWPNVEVIVVDDCSPDGTAEELRRRFADDARVKCHRNERNSFQAVSRNNGARMAKGEYVFILDDDNLVDPAVFRELMAAFARHPDAGLVAPLSVHRRAGAENLVWTLGSDFSRWTSRPRNRGANLPFDRLPPEPADCPTTYSPNAFMTPRKVYEELGGMDETFVQIYEESDFGWRVCESGRTAWIATKARTEHVGFLEPGCTPELRLLGIEKPARTFYFSRNRLHFAHRHFSAIQFACVMLLFAPLSAAYYVLIALRNRRIDIAMAYLKGLATGLFTCWRA